MRNIYFPNAKARRKGEVIAWGVVVLVLLSTSIAYMLLNV